MKSHYNLSDLEFERQFKNCTFNPKLFSHEAHIRLAWIYVNNYGVEAASENLCQQIKLFDATFDDGTKYNKTITVACVKTVNHFSQKSKATNFKDFILEFPRLKTNFKDLLDAHYGFDIYYSKEAKKYYLAPDLLPF